MVRGRARDIYIYICMYEESVTQGFMAPVYLLLFTFLPCLSSFPFRRLLLLPSYIQSRSIHVHTTHHIPSHTISSIPLSLSLFLFLPPFSLSSLLSPLLSSPPRVSLHRTHARHARHGPNHLAQPRVRVVRDDPDALAHHFGIPRFHQLYDIRSENG